MANPFVLIGLIGILALLQGVAFAQMPPTPAELSAYHGLHAAAAQGSVDHIQRLAQAGADPNGRDGNGRTPLHVAAFQGHRTAAQSLIAVGADPGLLDNQRYDAVTIAAVRDDVPTLQALLEALLAAGASAKLVTSIYDGTALIAAAHLGHDGIVGELIRARAPLDHANNLGWTALMRRWSSATVGPVTRKPFAPSSKPAPIPGSLTETGQLPSSSHRPAGTRAWCPCCKGPHAGRVVAAAFDFPRAGHILARSC
jgi:ankyrin repeat protein